MIVRLRGFDDGDAYVVLPVPPHGMIGCWVLSISGVRAATWLCYLEAARILGGLMVRLAGRVVSECGDSDWFTDT